MSWDEVVDLSNNDKRFIAACHAMQGFISNEDYVRAINYEDLAIRAVKATDALLAELEKK